MNQPQHEYLSEVGRSLGECQLLEFEIKMYIERAFDVVRQKTEGVIDFGFAGQDYTDQPLGKLIATLSKLTTNKQLIADLKELNTKRNFIAHKAVATCLNPEGDFDESSIDQIRPVLQEVAQESRRLVEAVYRESSRFLVHYFFSDVLQNDKK